MCRISIRKTGYVTASWSLPFGSERTVTLGPRRTLRGRVLDAAGDALTGFQVFVRGDDGCMASKMFGRAGGDASRRAFEWDGAPAVAGEIEIFADDGRTVAVRCDAAGSPELNLGDLVLPACGRVQLVTRSVPEPGVSPTLVWFRDDGDVDGSADFIRDREWTTSPRIPAGRLRAALFVEGALPVDLGTVDVAPGRTTRVTADPAPCGGVVAYVVSKGRPLGGVVVEVTPEASSPFWLRWRGVRSVAYGGRLRSYDADLTALRRTTSEQGRADFHRLPPGRASLSATRDGELLARVDVSIRAGAPQVEVIEIEAGR